MWAWLVNIFTGREVVPLDVVISERARLYRGSTNWEDWQIVRRPDWR